MVNRNPSRAERRVRHWARAGLRVAVVVPCYNVEDHIEEVVATLPDYIGLVVLVNDCSPDGTGELLDRLADERVQVVHLPQNRGVGGAVLAGFRRAAELDADIMIKMDGDGQMDPVYLPLLIEPLVLGQADYTKGNRFTSWSALAQMPPLRRLGNAVLSFMTRLASGYWNMFDPNNGYLAIRRDVFEMLPLSIVHERYFFESSMLIALQLTRAVVRDVPMPARYGTEQSHLRISRVLWEFPSKLFVGWLRRWLLSKVLFSLTTEAILTIAGLLLLLAGTAFGVVEFVDYALVRGVAAPAGTVMTAALPVFLGFQMLLNALVLDIQSVPTQPVSGPLDLASGTVPEEENPDE